MHIYSKTETHEIWQYIAILALAKQIVQAIQLDNEKIGIHI
jgi:hypothetical protein